MRDKVAAWLLLGRVCVASSSKRTPLLYTKGHQLSSFESQGGRGGALHGPARKERARWCGESQSGGERDAATRAAFLFLDVQHIRWGEARSIQVASLHSVEIATAPELAIHPLEPAGLSDGRGVELSVGTLRIE